MYPKFSKMENFLKFFFAKVSRLVKPNTVTKVQIFSYIIPKNKKKVFNKLGGNMEKLLYLRRRKHNKC